MKNRSADPHWLEAADYVYGRRSFLIGQDDNGNLCGPTSRRFPNGDRVWVPTTMRNPLHRLRYFSSWLQKSVAWVEPYGGDA